MESLVKSVQCKDDGFRVPRFQIGEDRTFFEIGISSHPAFVKKPDINLD
jgi:hypothetical protein